MSFESLFIANLLQGRPRRLPAPWDCPTCAFSVWEPRAIHDSLRHAWKTAVLKCDTCEHEDVICDDFADHMSKKHQVLLNSMEEIRGFTRTVGAFRKLNYCHNCGWRNSSSHAMRQHKETHTTAGVIPATPATPGRPRCRWSYPTEANTSYCACRTENAKPSCIFPTTPCFVKDCEFGSKDNRL